ncbi:hypothetical protein FRC09_001329 [Ceratobasidium sp. 395]|nr:hypothetical protein FRC09_001329 [Ceratobasidium sp. 395]
MPRQQVANRPAFVFDPPAGGDVTLRSADDSVFCVHSVILGLVSSVFADMLSIGRPSGEEIQLDDDSESIALMLAFVYPCSMIPTIDEINLLEKCLKISQKYNVEKIIQTLDHDLSRLEPQTRFIRDNNPLHIYRLAMTYGLTKCKVIAAKIITPRHINFCEPTEIVKAAQEYPVSAHLVGMISAQTLRFKILADVLFNFKGDFLPRTCLRAEFGQKSDFTDDEGAEIMMCDACASQLDILRDDGDHALAYVPSWLYGWSRYAYTVLSTQSMDERQEVFEPETLVVWIKDHIDVCEGCVQAATEARAYPNGPPGEVFKEWASEVRDLLKKRLGELDCLYSL